MKLDQVIEHVSNPKYQTTSGILDETNNEVYTPEFVVERMIKKYPDEYFLPGSSKIWLDPQSGTGNFLAACLVKKMSLGCTFEESLLSLRGVELELKSVLLCRERLIVGRNDLLYVIERNIVNADSRRYNYRFIAGEALYDSSPFENLFNVQPC